jgi:hypothetical protein
LLPNPCTESSDQQLEENEHYDRESRQAMENGEAFEGFGNWQRVRRRAGRLVLLALSVFLLPSLPRVWVLLALVVSFFIRYRGLYVRF